MPIGAYDIDAYNRVVRTNLDGVFHCLRDQLPAIEAAGTGGAIVNVSSILGSDPPRPARPRTSPPSTAWLDLRGRGRRVRPEGIRVNAVGPGFIDTPLLKEMEKAQYDGLVALHPAGRLGRPEEVAELVTFLLSSAPPSSTAATTWSTAPTRPSESPAALLEGVGRMKALQYRTIGAAPEVVTVPIRTRPRTGPVEVSRRASATRTSP